MATTGTNYTAKWALANGTLTISPVSGDSGEMRGVWDAGTVPYITKVVDMTLAEWQSVTSIVFTGRIAIKKQDLFVLSDYHADVSHLFDAGLQKEMLKNVTSIDVTGLNTTGCTSFKNMFNQLESLTEIIGIDTLDTSIVTDYFCMFYSTKISELDLSDFSNMNTAELFAMFTATNYLSTVILPSNFSRKKPSLQNDYRSFGIATSNIHATNAQTGVTVQSDEDFFNLESGQGGTWLRDITQSATLSFRISNVARYGNNVTVSYSYACSEATASIYLKQSSESSYPQTPTSTISLQGAGNGSTSLTVATDNSYEMQIVVTDGTTNLYVFGSVDSNVLLIEFDDDGNMKPTGDIKAAGEVEDGNGNILGHIKSLFSVEKYTYAYETIASGSALVWTETKTKAGYYPLGVVGFRTARQALLTNRCDITNAANGSCTINMNARAVASATANTAEMYVLWVKL